MYQKIILAVVLTAVFTAISIHTVYAQSPTVKECTQNPALEDCAKTNEGAGEGGNQINDTPSPSTSESPSIVLSLFKIVFALIFVVALIYFLLRFVNKRNKMFRNVRMLDNLGGVTLGPNRSIQLVRVGKKVYVIGVGENVELVTEITDEETIAELLNQDEPQEFKPGSIVSSILPSLTNKNHGDQEPSSIQFQQLFSKELDSLKDKRNEVIRGKSKGKEDKDE